MRTHRGLLLVPFVLLAAAVPAAAQQCLGVTPTSVTVSGSAGSVFTEALTLLNRRDSVIVYRLATTSGPCGITLTLPLSWAWPSPITGTLGPSGMQVVDVILDSTGLQAGTYTGTLCASSDACPDTPAAVLLSLVVTQPQVQEPIPILSAVGLAGLALLLLAAGLFVLRMKL